ncbi:hypothetical protein GW758_00465 [Candidatus Falkowbacteria bacterium]|nr:hypothetical protein [Candidatus Falkowbacteria bacterium]
MSLLEKLSEKKAEKKQREKEAEKNTKLQTMEEINAEITKIQTKKQRITTLKEALRSNYSGGGEAKRKLDNFKNKKATLKGAYEENKDILEDEGIENFEEMLEANANEPEVRQYRQAAGRGPAKENGEAGETGELHQAVGTLAQIKKDLQAEMPIDELTKKPEIKLYFSATVKEGEKMNNREKSFLQVEEYLKTLDTEIDELNKKKEEVYLTTPEGKKEELLKIDDPKNKLRAVDFNKVDNFYFESRVCQLSEKIGVETIKEVYDDELKNRLNSIAWDNKSLKNRDSYNNKSPEQLAIENYPALKKLNDLSYNYEDLNKFNKLHKETLDHLEKILTENESVYNRINQYGLYARGSNSYNTKQGGGWSDKRIVAENYLQHAASMAAELGDYDNLTKSFEISAQKASNKDFTSNNRDRISSPEYFQAKFVKFNKFLEYIKNNTDKNTVFVDNSHENTVFVDSSKKETSILSRVKRDKELREEIGLTKEIPSPNLDVPAEFINRNGGFYESLSKARGFNDVWEKEKKKLAEISAAAVDSRFAQDWERYFSEKHRDLLTLAGYRKKLAMEIEYSLKNLKNSELLNTPEFANRKIRLNIKQSGYSSGFNDTIIKDLSADEEYKRISEAGKPIKAAIEEYANNKKTERDKAAGSLKRQIIAFGREGKLKTLNDQWQVFEDFKNDKPLNEANLKSLGITEEEIAEMKDHRQKKNDNDAEYKKYDQTRLNFLHASSVKSFFLPFKSGDILDGQEMKIEELPARLEARLNELKIEQSSLPESEVAIIAERDRAVEEVKSATDKFQKVMINNAEVLRKYRS